MSVKKRKVLFIVMPYLLKRSEAKKQAKIRSFKAFPYGLLSVITYVENKLGPKVQMKILDCNFSDESHDDYLDHLKDQLDEFKPDIVGLSMMFDNSYEHLPEICNVIDVHNKDTLILMGGTAAFTSYQTILEEQEYVDAICYAEGEIPFLKLLESENLREYLEIDPSWVTKDVIEKGKKPAKTYVMNLDEVIDINYKYVDVKSYAMQEGFSPYAESVDKRNQFFITNSRGCPFKCTFCWKSADDDKLMRYASIERIGDHLQRLIDEYGLNVLTIYDDQLLYNRKWAKELFRMLARLKIRVECPNGLTVAYIDDEMAEVMRAGGVDTVNLAIESGSPYVLNKLIKKPLRVEQIGVVVNRLRKFDFWIHGFFVSGMPGEQDEHRAETVKLIKDVGLDWAGFSLALPSRGSKLWELCIDKGYIDKDMPIGALTPSKYIINTSDYSTEYITRQTYLMNLDVNFVHNHRMKVGDYVFAYKIFRDVIRRYDNHAFAYHFMAEAMTKMGQDSTKERQIVRDIVEKDEVWREYFNHFNMMIEGLCGDDSKEGLTSRMTQEIGTAF